jgi:PAS domain S-box-containing protein
MDASLILVLSILLQLTAAYLALRLIAVTGRRVAWILIAAGLCLMALRRGITFYQLLFWEVATPLEQTAELVALAISVLMVAGMAWIAPLFRSIKSSRDALRLNESRLEALWKLSQMTEASMREITDYVLEEAVDLTNSKIGYLAFANEDETILTMYSWSKTVKDQCTVIDQPVIYPVETTGLWGEALRQRRPMITNDYAAPNVYKRGYPEGHVILQRHLNIPVFDGDHIVIVAGVGNKVEPYDESDVRQLTLLMQGMWRLVKHKQTEESLSHEIERMHQLQTDLIQTSSDGIIANDREGNIIIYNEGAERILGYRKAEVIGKLKVDKLYPPGLAREVKKKIYSPAYGGPGRLIEYEVIGVSKTGEHIPAELSASLIFEDDQEVGIVGFFRDLRERKQMQKRLLESEQLVAVGQMAAHISHEIKNPMMVIGGFARQLLRDIPQDPQKTRKKLQIMVEEISRLEDFCAEVGGFARIAEIDKHPGNLNALIQEICERLEPSLSEKGITLSVNLDRELPTVQFDPSQLRQVILNIAKNGVEAMSAGGSLTVTSGKQQDRVFVEITDTGEGIPAEILDKVFQPFFSTKLKGSGLGLAISQKIIEAHQGQISIESHPPQGTRVTLLLKPGLSVTNSN